MADARSFFEKRLNRMLRRVHRLCELGGMRTPPERTVFMHIPKCGGTSINWAAKSYLGNGGSDKVVLVDDTVSPAIHREQVARALDAMFVSGHFGFETLERIRGTALVFTVVREPYARLRSVHTFLGELEKRNPIPDRLRTLSPLEFYSCRDDAVLQWTDNVMARTMAVSWDRSRVAHLAPQELAAKAIGNLAAFDVIASTHSLTRDMAELSQRTRLPTLARLGWKNASGARRTRAMSAESQARLDGKLRAAALPLISADLAVYAHVQVKPSAEAPLTPPLSGVLAGRSARSENTRHGRPPRGRRGGL